MNNNLELIYWTSNGGVELPLEDWQYKVIAQVLGLSVQEDESGNITFSHFPKDFVVSCQFLCIRNKYPFGLSENL